MDALVIGSINMDLVVRCDRIAAPGHTVIADHSASAPGGKGGNQAAAVARLGGRCRFVGCVGDDDAGARSVTSLDADGVDTTWVRRVAGPTGLAIVLVDDAGENAITVIPGANLALDAAHVEQAFAAPGDLGVVLASLEVPLPAVAHAGTLARARGVPFVLNPAPARPLPPALLGTVDVLCPNEHEAAALGGPAALLDAGVGAVVVTLGGAGCAVHRKARPPLHVPAHPVDVVDTTGAGDAFAGAVAWALACGRSLDDAVRLATVAGALATRAAGARTSLPTAADLAPWS